MADILTFPKRQPKKGGAGVSENVASSIIPADSQKLKKVMRASKNPSQTPQVRQEKLKPLLRAVRQGRYHIDFRKLADRLILLLLMGCV